MEQRVQRASARPAGAIHVDDAWEMVARYVVPALNGTFCTMQASADHVAANKDSLMAGASAAIMQKIVAHDGAQAALGVTMQEMAERAGRRESFFRPGAGVPES